MGIVIYCNEQKGFILNAFPLFANFQQVPEAATKEQIATTFGHGWAWSAAYFLCS